MSQILIIGGCGFIGRNLVELLVNSDDVSHIRVVDKVPPQMAWLTGKHKSVFESSKVEFKSGNLLNAVSREAAFRRDDGTPFDYVINLAAETKLGQTDPVYNEGIVNLSLGCAEEAGKTGVKRFIEISIGNMSSPTKHPMKESDSVEPWTAMAKHKRTVEERLLKLKTNLDYVIVRPGLVYGPGDRNSIMPWVAIASVYKCLSEPMELLWTEKLRKDVCHVQDLARAIWHLCQNGKSREIYNVTDTSFTTLGEIIQLICGILDVKFKFVGNILSTVAKWDLEGVAEDGNDKHLPVWSRLCSENCIENTPLSPYLAAETLLGSNLWLDTTKLQATGFVPLYPKIEASVLKEVIDEFVQEKLFPASVMD